MADFATDFTYRPYRPDLRDGTLRLMDKVQGVPTAPDEFQWWFVDNPGGPMDLFLATDGDTVVGCNSFTPYLMSFGGRLERVGFPQKICVDEVCRGKGVFLKLQKRLEDAARPHGVRLLLGFPNDNAYPIWTGKWGCLDVPGLRLWMRVERPAAVLARARVPRPIGEVLGWPYRALFARGRGRERWGDLTLSPIDRFDERADALWARYEPSLPRATGMIVRSAAYLNWRYLDAPSRRYRALGLWRGEALVGFAAVGVADRAGLRMGLLCDLLVEPSLPWRARGLLLDRALGELRGQAVDAISALVPAAIPPAVQRADQALLASRLFAPTPRVFPIIAKALDEDAARSAALLLPGALRFTLGDLDFF